MGPVQGIRLSPQQKQLWATQGEGAACRSRCAVSLAGALDRKVLAAAVRGLAARHEALRTTFERAPGFRVPLQVVGDPRPPAWLEVSLEHLSPESQEREVRERFAAPVRRDLSQGPVLAATLLALDPRRHVLLLELPALCADGRSLGILVRELADLYAARLDASPEDVVQYAQFSEWQNALLEESSGQGPALPRRFALPMELQGREGSPFAPDLVARTLPAGAAADLARVAGERGASLEILLLAAWQALLSRLAGSPEVPVDVVFDNRGIEDLENTVGLLSGVAPVSCRCEPALPLAGLLDRVEAAWRDAAELAAAPPSVSESPAEAPVGFDFTALDGALSRNGIEFSIALQGTLRERCKLWLSALGNGERLELLFHYDPEVFRRGDVELLSGQYVALLAGLPAAPERPVGAVGFLAEGERRELVEAFNRTARDYPRELCVHELFEQQARRSPEAVAVVWADRRMSFGELDREAGRLARRLRGLGVGPETRVGLLLERSPAQVVALLAVLKAGGAYVPLDPSNPRERLAWLVSDSGLGLVLTQESLADRLPTEVRRLLVAEETADAGPETALEPLAGPDNLAYVLYTSGSTGRPKGVMVPHRALVNYVSWALEAYGAAEGSGAPVHSPLAFDLTVTGLLVPLLAGNRVLLLSEAEGVEALGLALRREGDFSLVKLTPAHLRILAQELTGPALADRTRALVVGGEALTWESLEPWRAHAPQTRVINEYGPTEAAVGCCVHEVTGEGRGPVPIGRPIANARIYLLDRELRPVPRWVAGEIHVGGDGLARGYLGRGDLTAASFVPDPFGAPGERLYRTGDLARFGSDGTLEFLGREDHQVKVRGFRIELGEVEQALLAHPGVSEAVVGTHEDASGDRRLVAWVVGKGGAKPGLEELRRHLSERLPEPMLPSSWVELAALPLTANGKVNRKALPAPGEGRPELEQAYVPPRTPLEETLVAAWSAVLGIERIGVHDSFFTLGGDSMRSVQAVALLRQKGLEVEIQDLFRHPTAEKLAGEIAARTLPGEGVSPGAEEDLDDLLARLEGLSDEQVQEALRERMSRSAVGEVE